MDFFSKPVGVLKPEDLEALARSGIDENQTLEFKSALPNHELNNDPWVKDRKINDAAKFEVLKRLVEAGIRAELDSRSVKVNLKIRDAQLQKIPYMLIIGAREAEAGTVAVRHRKKGDQGAKPLDDFLAEAASLIAAKATSE